MRRKCCKPLEYKFCNRTVCSKKAMKVKDFTLLAEMLNGKVTIQMNKFTHKYLYSVSGTIDISLIEDSQLKMNYHGQKIEHDAALQDRIVRLVAKYNPRLADSLTIELE